MDPIGRHISFLKYLNRRPSSVLQRRLTLRRLERFAGAEILAVDPETLARFVNRRSLGVEARAASVSHLRGFYRWALDEGLIERDPSARLQRPKRERRIPRPMPDEHASRACEIAQVRGADFRVANSPPILIIRISKGGDPSVVPIAAELRQVALECSRAKDWCFPKGRGGDGHITPSQVQKRANTFLHEIGVGETLHQLRHWYGTKTYRASGRDLRATQELLRHLSPVSTAGYTYIDPGDNATALDLLPRLTA